MPLHLATHSSSLEHHTPRGHPERVDRITAVTGALRSGAVDVLELDAPKVHEDLLASVHSRSYLESVRTFCSSGGGSLDPDTYVVPASYEAALHAAGAGPALVNRMRTHSGPGFVAVRPPGHHAERDRAMGFCLFNNIAVTAKFLAEMGQRVAIVDWDVHHGNGTQNTFFKDPSVMYVSLHEFPFYPGTGWVSELGEGDAVGTTINIALPNGTTSTDYLAAFRQLVLPPVRQFDPSWILISNGYDAHVDDPLGGLRLESEHYGWMAAALCDIVPSDRIVAFLEGGYDLGALESGSIATARGLLGAYGDFELPDEVVGQARRVTDMAADLISRHWDLG